MQVSKRQFVILWVLSIVGALAILPYIHYMGLLPPERPLWLAILLSAGQAAVLFGLVCWVSYKIVRKTDLRPFPSLPRDQWLSKIVVPAVIAGVVVGLILFVLDQTLFYSSVFSAGAVPMWIGALGSIYGAINEEIGLRLFLFSLLYFLASKWIKKKRTVLLWGVTIVVALLFGVGHLPIAFRMITPSSFEIVRILVLNGIAGVVLGWLYWSRGLWAAIGAHFVADLVIHGLL
jgi:hypothetical protein